jgi:hypothetical protein
MLDILKSKIKSWSHARLIEHAQYLPIAPLGDRNVGFYEIDESGLYVIKKYKVIAYNNDNTIATLIDLKSVNSTEHDFNTITQLYKNGVNIVEPIETAIEDNLEYTLYKSLNDQIGIPFTAEYFINKKFDDAYVEQYIIEIATLIKSLSTLQCFYPDTFVGFENRLKNDVGYYYFNIINFNSAKADFINIQLEYFQYVLNNPVFESIDKLHLLEQARQQWR